MKKNYLLSFVCATLLFTSCGTGGGIATGTGSTGAALAGSSNSTTSLLTSAGTGVLGTLMSTLLGNTTTTNSIVGTWVYSGPKIAFESENILAQLGSTVASAKLEQTLGTQLQRIGFTNGKTSMAFDSNGSCQMSFGQRTLPGTYTYNQKTGQMTVQGALGLTTITPYVSVVGNEMYIMFEADKLLSVLGAVSSVAKVSTLTSILSSYNGLRLGWKMSKK